MPHVIAIANQKGGVGKSTTAINLGASLAVAEKRTLVIDIDPQANATSGLGIEINDQHKTIYDVLVRRIPIKDTIVRELHFPCLDVISSTRDLCRSGNRTRQRHESGNGFKRCLPFCSGSVRLRPYGLPSFFGASYS
ncbi:MAG: hypothetical protein CM1200mP14_04110 [Gammaproteobacteria bacterium]|nr:MAG: hypothetical protein CM1200mP14_04110 [Gammaproteobacteria bacterium]